jgi:RimJ/RimL family protein N-acetyltransferase
MTITPAWVITTGRLRLVPVGYWDLPDLVRLKGDPRAFALMLGGVRGPVRVAEELAHEIQDWGRHGFGVWAVRARRGKFLGITALQHRPDGLGVALRFAFLPEVRGAGLAVEAAGAALRYGHEVAGLSRVVAIARESNFASRAVLGAIGMSEHGRFARAGEIMLIYQSVR